MYILPMPALLPVPGFADPVSSLSHLVGAAVFAALTVPLLRRGWGAGDAPGPRARRILALALFAASAVGLLSISGVFHLLGHDSPARGVLQRLDHAAIFVLIAGTFTPIQTILFRGPWRWGMLVFIWTLAAVGVTLKSIFFTATSPGLGVAVYLGMGWVGASSVVAIALRRGLRFVVAPVLGGLAYTAGAAVEWAEPPALVAGVIRAHEIFHLAVLLGLALHWRFVWLIAAMSPRPAPHAPGFGPPPLPTSRVRPSREGDAPQPPDADGEGGPRRPHSAAQKE